MTSKQYQFSNRRQLPLQGPPKKKPSPAAKQTSEPVTRIKGNLQRWIDNFMLDRRSMNVTPSTLRFYKYKFLQFTMFCAERNIADVEDITANDIREFLVSLEEKGRSQGGIHACYRALHTFLNFYEEEADHPYWRNPIKKVKAPINPIEPLPPVELETVEKLINVCDTHSIIGLRDHALMLVLLDTGLRAAELVALTRSDVDLVTGAVEVVMGKGRKSRTVFLASRTRRALRNYLQQRTDEDPHIWMSREGHPLTYWGLLQTLERRCEDAGVAHVRPHDFRRAFALNCIRNGMNVYALRDLMGHSDLQVLIRYVKHTKEDLRQAHDAASPVNRANLK